MQRLIVLLTFATAITYASSVARGGAGGQIRAVGNIDKIWEEWKDSNSRTYEAEDEVLRRYIWEDNLSMINKHNYEYNLGKHTFALQMNHLGDMTNNEINAMLNGFLGVNRTDTRYKSPMNIIHANLPDMVDWRNKGYVTEVKDQKNCGSCYAFSATGSLEGQHFKKTGKLVSLSEQQFIDCSDKYGNAGCGGGLMDNCFLYVQDHKGNDLEECYPYEAKYNWCRFNKTESCIGATDSGFVDLPMFDEDALKNAVATVGPISVAIDASKSTFHYYKTGVYNELKCSSKNLDHGVLAVGYGTDNDGVDYWLVKNSWGASWGEEGYIKMSRNANNQCGIATQASYPKV